MKHPIRSDRFPKCYRGTKLSWTTCWFNYRGERLYESFPTKAKARSFAQGLKKKPELLHHGFSDIYITWSCRLGDVHS